ncbi:MAG TPA: hypothetical protein VHZ54_19795 [Solirubrobacterales bacterium]|jgi:hypothetical protein|nr:hypothetical protein [Solirubrobacterales bacterium]
MTTSRLSAQTPLRLLLVLCREVCGPELRSRVTELAAPRPLNLHLLVPSFADSRLQFLASDIDGGMRRARRRLAGSVGALAPIAAAAEVGEADPLMAIDTALVGYPAELIVIVPSARRDQWAEDGLLEHVCRRFDLPVEEIELSGGAVAID